MSRQLLLWSPRILGLLCAGFASLFAFDVLSPVAIVMNLIPAGIVLAMVAISWRWQRVGGALFLLAGLAYCVTAGLRWDWMVFVAGPLFAVGILFVASGRKG